MALLVNVKMVVYVHTYTHSHTHTHTRYHTLNMALCLCWMHVKAMDLFIKAISESLVKRLGGLALFKQNFTPCQCSIVCVQIVHVYIPTARWSLFGNGDPMDFWQVIVRFASPSSVSSIMDMEEIQTDLGRVSVLDSWLCLSLEQYGWSVYFVYELP